MSSVAAAPAVALVGNPNAGKTSLFNALTGARQKVANYPGVTVERKVGVLRLPDGSSADLIDLPGAYSLDPRSPDEMVTRDVLLGRQEGEAEPRAVIAVVDATNLSNQLRFVLELVQLGRPVVVALNMMDLAQRDGLTIDRAALERELGIPVVETVAVRRRGLEGLADTVLPLLGDAQKASLPQLDTRALQRRARDIANAVVSGGNQAGGFTRRLDRLFLHPLAGPLILAAILFLMFQAVFAWASAPQDWIDGGIAALQNLTVDLMPPGVIRDFIIEGLLAGVGAVIIFLPQIVILFAFILVLEQSGYMVRAAFLMDKLMASVGLSGRSFIPLLSSFACAIPGIMATRTIADPKDRMTTIMIAPLMTCSARLPVYAVIIAAFIPSTNVGPFGLQGLVLFGLYAFGIVGALVAALALRRTVTRGTGTGFMMEMPKYQVPALRDLMIGIWQRAYAFLRRAGTIILAATVVLWLFASYPVAPEGESQVDYSLAGRIGSGIETVVSPIGFNRDIAIALVPAMAAREVAVAALGTVYAIDSEDEEVLEGQLASRLGASWSLPTALAFLAWFVFAPQCISTFAVTRRETNSWRWPVFMFAYLFAMAYVGAGLTYWIASALLG
ncbi:ferrous iron transporter B [Pacificimonas flava]|uniref:Ferrous iron transport protein B n=2 Tax=Pacificimonas TaxID=1960290 RepID=A0A219B5R1_9SPHN|nr:MULTISPECIES: ferrous iron transporter B [Pacificimonas]MBZ6379266.1 ferrous iron transporter B [Pacificimonas aurantium]OWV33524.1 ferrous iron transporter B [Pacificimonas flava]